jgi:glutamate synthase (NADPH/NADH) large chain/glutamate synthase (ferredoxin)
MVQTSAEAVGSMGDDTPLAVLSLQPRLLYTYFKQLFAQVTNPPIDPIREKLVMSLKRVLGWRRNLLAETSDHARLVRLESPVLFRARTHRLARLGRQGFPSVQRSMPPGRSRRRIGPREGDRSHLRGSRRSGEPRVHA